MVSPFVWQQGKWAKAPAGDVPAPYLPPCSHPSPPPSVFLSSCLPWSSSCFSPAAGPAAADRSKVISPWFVFDGFTMVPAMAPFSSWPCGLVRERSPAGWPPTSTSMPSTSFNLWLTPGLFLVLASRLTYENQAYRWSITRTKLALLPSNHVNSRAMVSYPSQPVALYPSRLGRWRTDQWSLFSLLSFSYSSSPRALGNWWPA